MANDSTPSMLLATALQHLFEICSQLAELAPPEEKPLLEKRLKRLQKLRAELLEWVDEQRI